MPLPLIPIAIAGLSGAFIGSQIDDKVESPLTSNLDGSTFFGIGTVLKVGLLAGSAFLLATAYKKVT